jgi:hypothetical protein
MCKVNVLFDVVDNGLWVEFSAVNEASQRYRDAAEITFNGRQSMWLLDKDIRKEFILTLQANFKSHTFQLMMSRNKIFKVVAKKK